jgi:anaerobic magnesium-protoporphyrin IX monomethyl ester cyclase
MDIPRPILKIILIFPPPWPPYQPYLSLPTLAAFLRSKGCHVVQRDINIELFNRLLTKEKLTLFFDMMADQFELLNRKETLSFPEQKRYYSSARVNLVGEFVKSNINKAREIFKNKNAFYDPQKLWWAYRVVMNAFEIISLPYYPTKFSLNTFQMGNSTYDHAELIKNIYDEKQNPFLNFFSEEILRSISIEKPDIVGLSIASTDQIIPAFTLARLLKDYELDTHITIGGPVFTRLTDNIQKFRMLFDVIDSIIIDEGESALLRLAKEIKGDHHFENIPNFVFRKNGKIYTNMRTHLENLDEIPTPDFNGLPLDLYFSPEIVLPLQTSRGCYWQKCTFCDRAKINGNKYFRRRAPSLILNDLTKLSRITNFFSFWDDMTLSRTLQDISTLILEKDLEIQWIAQAKLESSYTLEVCRLLRRAGCRQVTFGLESGCQRVLESMQKGIKVEEVPKILKNFHDAGISTSVNLIIGFPGETREEALETMNFIIDNKDIFSRGDCNVNRFRLRRNSAAAIHPESFSISTISGTEKTLALEFKYQTHRGLNFMEVDEIVNHIRQKFTRNGITSDCYGPWFLLYQWFFKTPNPADYPKPIPKPFPLTGKKLKNMEGLHLKLNDSSLTVQRCPFNIWRIRDTLLRQEQMEIQRETNNKSQFIPPKAITYDSEQTTYLLFDRKQARIILLGPIESRMIEFFQKRTNVSHFIASLKNGKQDTVLKFFAKLISLDILFPD